MHRQTFKTTLSDGGGEGKHSCDYDCVSIPGKEEISKRFWFVSTSFVRGCGSIKFLLLWLYFEFPDGTAHFIGDNTRAT